MLCTNTLVRLSDFFFFFCKSQPAVLVALVPVCFVSCPVQVCFSSLCTGKGSFFSLFWSRMDFFLGAKIVGVCESTSVIVYTFCSYKRVSSVAEAEARGVLLTRPVAALSAWGIGHTWNRLCYC